MNRKDYMENMVSHQEYYGSIAKEAHISMDKSPLLPRCRAAYDGGDDHLNTITLATWDRLGSSMMAYSGDTVRAILKSRGDGDSMATRVCILKAAMIDAIEKAKETVRVTTN